MMSEELGVFRCGVIPTDSLGCQNGSIPVDIEEKNRA